MESLTGTYLIDEAIAHVERAKKRGGKVAFMVYKGNQLEHGALNQLRNYFNKYDEYTLVIKEQSCNSTTEIAIFWKNLSE